MLKALLGDYNIGALEFKAALHFDIWLKPPRDGRLTLFRTIKRAYGATSNAVHAGKVSASDEKQLDELGGIVRDCLLIFSDCQILADSVPMGNELDRLMLTCLILSALRCGSWKPSSNRHGDKLRQHD